MKCLPTDKDRVRRELVPGPESKSQTIKLFVAPNKQIRVSKTAEDKSIVTVVGADKLNS